MSINKQVNHERVLAYQSATTLTYEEMEQVAGGGYVTMWKSPDVAKVSGADPRLALDTAWDQ